jgi:general L-amino acid transport system permease protein
VVRAIAGLTLFSAAYLAENVRGGLQAIPRGQAEAARALGLNPALVVSLIVLPQALKAVIPAIVGQFISLFKDTSLLALFGLLELTGMARSILAQPQYLGRYSEVYLFIGLIYWVFCYGMSLASRRLEKRLNVGQR